MGEVFPETFLSLIGVSSPIPIKPGSAFCGVRIPLIPHVASIVHNLLFSVLFYSDLLGAGSLSYARAILSMYPSKEFAAGSPPNCDKLDPS